MAYPTRRKLNEKYVSAYMADLSTASSAFCVAPSSGTIEIAYSTIYNAITVADAVWTMKINGTAVTGVSVTVANTSSAAGDVDSGTPTGANYVNAGDVIEFVSDGASTTTCPVTFTAVIRERS